MSKHVGAIGFNLDPNVKSHKLPTHLISLFQEAFSALPHDVVWKWDKKKMTDHPINVYITDYLVQYDMMGKMSCLYLHVYCITLVYSRI